MNHINDNHPEGNETLSHINPTTDHGQVSETVSFGLSNTSQSSGASSTCNHLHHGDEDDPDVNLDCPWAPLMNDYETAINTADHPLTAREIGEILSSENLQLGIDKLDFSTAPWALRNGAEWEFDKITTHNDHYPGTSMETSRILPGGQLIYLWYHQPEDNTPPVLTVRHNPSQDAPLVTLKQALAIAREAWDNVSELFVLTDTFADARLLRLDIAADFAPVANLRGVLSSLNQAQPRPRWTRKNIESSGTTGGITVEHSTKTAGTVTAYDKSAQAQHDTPTLRIEAKLSSRAKKKFELQHIHQLNDASLRRAFDHLAEPFRQALLRQPDLSSAIDQYGDRRIIEAIGYLYCTAYGLPVTASRERTYFLRKILKTLGINSIDELGTM